MMTRYPAPDVVPGDMWGKRQRDPLLVVVGGLISSYMGAVGMLRRREIESPDIGRSRPMVVRERRVEANDENVVSLVLAAPDGGELASWRPGAHLDIELPSGRKRQYSLCGDPADSRLYRIAVRRIPDGAGGSIEIHDELSVGSEVVITGPRNAFPFAMPGFGSPAERVHFVAGGIGITPILPMMRMAQRIGIDWSMVYTGRSRESLPFLAELAEFGDRVTIRTDDEDGLPEPTALLAGVTETTAVYCCGPMPMIDRMREMLRTATGVEFHYERFSAPPVVDGKPFEVELARTGAVISVPADRSALDAIADVKPGVAYSCRQGFCGTCHVKVLSGTPDHREVTLTDDEHDSGDMLICVSRADGGRLVLDI